MNLDNICIRAKVDGKWGSYTLRELVNVGKSRAAMCWILDQVIAESYKTEVTSTMLIDALRLLDQYKKI